MMTLQFKGIFMTNFTKISVIATAFLGLSACGGSDTEDRLDVADPVVRFVHAQPLAPALTLFRNDIARSEASAVPYKSVTNYLFVDGGAATWQVKTSQSNLLLGNLTVDAKRGNRYTVVVFPSGSTDSSLYEIRDPYNKSITSDQAKLRIVNGSFNASNIDLYITSPGTSISAAGVVPVIVNTAYKTAGPPSGSDSLDLDAGTYQITITSAGSKTILFKGLLGIEKNKDVLLLTLPDSLLPNAVKTVIKVDGDAGSKELPAN
jgi:Domain of unknown function (DUF4397)